MRYFRLGTAGMRGEIGTGLTPVRIMNFASAFGTYHRGGRIVVASDTRFSSTMLRHATFSGLMSCGSDVISCGTAPAPVLNFMVPFLKADGGLLLGAGHHPAGWNAIIPLDSTGAPLNSAQFQELLDIYHSKNYGNREWNKTGILKKYPDKNFADSYLDMICSLIDTEAVASAGFRVVVDFCNGSGSPLAHGFAKRLGIVLLPINDTLSGILPHDPEPRPRSSFQVKSVMKLLNADVGFVFNSDVSRLAVVTNTRETLSEEYTFPLVADHMLSGCPDGASVITNCCTTRTLDEIVARHKCELVKTKVGQAPVIREMVERGALLAGDGSGSIAFRDSVRGFDGFMAAAVILEAMALQKSSSAELAEKLPRYHIIKKKVQCPSAHAYSLLRALKNHYPDAGITEKDGFRFDWEDGWVHLRASATEPVVRMIVEWKDAETADEVSMQLRGNIERLVSS